MSRHTDVMAHRVQRWLVASLLIAAATSQTIAATIEEARELLRRGKYTECIEVAARQFLMESRDEDWALILGEANLAVGRYTNALEVITSALTRSRSSFQLRLMAIEATRLSGRPGQVPVLLEEMRYTISRQSWAYQDPINRVAAGRALLLMGSEPRLILENFFDVAKKREPKLRDIYLAVGELALSKRDDAVAAKAFTEGLGVLPDDPDLLCGLARAYSSSDIEQMLAAIESALEYNPRHTSSLLLLADHLIDAEEYDEAEKRLAEVLLVNPVHPEAWAYRSVLAHLRADKDAEAKARQTALMTWTNNPAVDHLIGEKLSQKYRFAEAAQHQYRALSFEPDYLPAKLQLSQDLLRLGREDEGWRLTEEVQKRDAYSVEAYNLTTLRDTMRRFQVLTNEHFILRMATNEAALYGVRALNLLERARSNLCARYELKLDGPITVEVFPEQKDFAVRTFGLPHNPGFLGVCFGPVITANSPASQGGSPANWEAVLWHEFVHVITLHLTRNKMPRWLSEGISVYEERQANPAWGQAMNPEYRERILGGRMNPIGEMSSAFLTSKTGADMQFAYFQSYLVVEFLAGRFGLSKLRNILVDLAAGKPVNAAIEAHTQPMKQLEKDFAAFARSEAGKLAPSLKWDKPKPGLDASERLNWAGSRTNNYYALKQRALKLISEKKWQEAKPPLNALNTFYPDEPGSEGTAALLAWVHRELKETEAEQQALLRWAGIDADALEAYERLMELGKAAGDWGLVATNAERFLAVNPLVAPPYQHLAEAAEQTGNAASAIQAYRALLQLDPADPALLHFRLAKQLFAVGDSTAKRQVLMALEETPRFRDAQRLLLEITAREAPSSQ